MRLAITPSRPCSAARRNSPVPLPLHVVADDQRRRRLGRHDLPEQRAPLGPGQVLDPAPLQVQQVERHVGERAAAVLQGVEVGLAAGAEHDHLAVEHGLLAEQAAAQVGELGVRGGQVAAGAAAQLGGVGGHQRERPVAVPLELEGPGGVVERRVPDARQHRPHRPEARARILGSRRALRRAEDQPLLLARAPAGADEVVVPAQDPPLEHDLPLVVGPQILGPGAVVPYGHAPGAVLAPG